MKNILIAVCSAILPLAGATITNISVVNLSTADYTVETTWQSAQFRSSNVATSSVSVTGALSEFSNQFSWLLAGRSVGFPDGASQANARISYELFFTVEDPGGFGYLIAAETRTLGWLTALWEGAPGLGGFVGASAADLEVEVSIDGVYFAAPGLTASGGDTTADEFSPFANDPTIGGGSALSTLQSGTHVFSFRFTSMLSRIGTSEGADGESAIRFGLSPTINGLTTSGTPGDDGTPSSDLGHFLHASVLSFEPQATAVPEPGTFIPLAALLIIGLKHRQLSKPKR